MAGDDLSLNLGSALVDPRRPNLSVEVLEEMALLEGPGAVELDGGVHCILGDLSGKELGHRGDVRDMPGSAARMARKTLVAFAA
jgi:hypothetical protein